MRGSSSGPRFLGGGRRGLSRGLIYSDVVTGLVLHKDIQDGLVLGWDRKGLITVHMLG